MNTVAVGKIAYKTIMEMYAWFQPGGEHYLVILHEYRIISYFVRSKDMRRQLTVKILKPLKYFIQLYILQNEIA